MSSSSPIKKTRSDSVISNTVKKDMKSNPDKEKMTMVKKEMAKTEKEKVKKLEEELLKLKMDNKEKNDTILNLKLEKKEAISTITNFNSLQIMKADTDKANAFFKMIMKDNLLNYKENHNPAYVDEDESNKSIKVKKSILKDNSVNRYECKCNACLVLLSESSRGNYVRMKKMVKHVEITRGVIMGLSYDSSKFDYENFVMTDNKKNINLMYKGFDKSKINITFTLSKSSNLNMEDLDIGANKLMSITSSDAKISYASFMIVEAMRNLISMSIEENTRSFSKVTVEEGINDCFSSVMSQLISNFQEPEKFTKFMINDLTEEEEMVLLTESWNRIVYIKKSTKKDMKNHISLDKFEDCQEMMVMLLVTPMFRDVMFFSNKEETVNLTEDSIVEWSNDMVDAYTTEMMKNVDTSSDSGNGTMMPRLNTHRQGDKKFNRFFNIEKTMEYHKSLPLSDFKKNMMVEAGFDSEDVESYSLSKMFNLTIDHEPLALKYLMLYYMTFNEFRALAYFKKSIRDFVKMIFWSDYDDLYLKMKAIPFNILEIYYDEHSPDNLADIKDNIEIFNDFMSSMDKMGDLNNNVMHDMYLKFRNGVKDYLVMDRMATYMDSQKLDNREYYMCLVDRTKDFDDFENIRFKMLKSPELFDRFKINLLDVEELNQKHTFYDSTVSIEKMFSRNRLALLHEDLKNDSLDS